ncbi:MAG: tetratricopeptide repeat protein [Candidatus Parcubacteria bacterium]|nr:tetratricopeptide repeat protein [Candidatus Parcubacteria bacterium]
MYNILPLIIILICLAVILAIIFKKLPLLAVFDVNAIPEEKEAETKNKIMEQRLDRRLKLIIEKIKPFWQLLANFFQRKIKASKERIAKLEEKYQAKTKQEPLTTKEEFETKEKKIAKLLQEGENLAKSEDYNSAENKYIEILNLEAKNIEAYRGLGDLYILQKQFQEAIQTFKHIIKLNKTDSLAHFELAEVFVRLEDYDNALNNLNKALEIEPVSPKYLDLLLTISIIIKNKEMAKEGLTRLKAVNPENAKIEEFEQKIREL